MDRQIENMKNYCKTGPLISVVVPVYNSEKTLRRCVDSILAQTYENLEVILVNDGSSDKSERIINRYAQEDERVTVVNHPQNLGLFQTRITGADNATGKYLAFVDSDDYLSIDWFRTLIKKAESTESDIVVGEWAFDFLGKGIQYLNLDPFRIREYNLRGEEAAKAFIEQEFRCFSWSVIWNKLYRLDLWRIAEPSFKAFSEEYGRMQMWEDVVFSTGLWLRAKRVTNVHHVLYFYVKHQDAMTNKVLGRKKTDSYISNVGAAIGFLGRQLKEKNLFEKYESSYLSWKQRAAGILCSDLGKKKYEQKIRETIGWQGELEDRPAFFYSEMTALAADFSWLEDIKKGIVSERTEYVSFDVFDTLIQRPFFFPTDLFSVLSDRMNRGNASFVDYAQARVDSERRCRQIKSMECPSCEEITLDEIYDTIRRNYCFPDSVFSEMQLGEIDLEKTCASARSIGKDLFELAQDAGKKIIICSDIYLPGELVGEILQRNGYSGYEKLYVSSELRLTKATGNLYGYISRELHAKGSEIVHIGDNWQSDVVNAQKKGWRSFHVSKAVDMLQNSNPGIYSGELFQRVFLPNGAWEDYSNVFNCFRSMRDVLGVIANRLFGYPFISMNGSSDFNGQPGLVGYACLGPHLLGLCSWIEQIAKEEQIPTIHFVARDGYIIKQAFDLLNKGHTGTNYIRLSRKSLTLADVDSADDLYSIYRKANILQCTAEDLAELLEPIIPKERTSAIPELLSDHGLFFDRRFADVFEYEKCLKVFIEEIVDFSLLDGYKSALKDYFSQIIKPGDYIFDVGYSGRPESALTNLLGYPVGSMYVHVNSEVADQRQRKYHCKNYCYYNVKPRITGVIREHILMELGPSTIGYHVDDGRMVPTLEEYEPSYESDFMTEILQKEALRFVADFSTSFPSEKTIPFQALSAPFEYYLHYSKAVDRQLFSATVFEDRLGEGKTINALDFWNNETIRNNLSNRSQLMLKDTDDSIYEDGLFMRLYRWIGRVAPKGSKRRERIKKFFYLFLRK